MSSIIDQVYKNDSIDRAKIPITQEHRRVKTNERDVIFHLNAHFDFENLIWKSGIFKIPKNKWAVTNTDEYKYPILGKMCNRSYVMSQLMTMNLETRLSILNVNSAGKKGWIEPNPNS